MNIYFFLPVLLVIGVIVFWYIKDTKETKRQVIELSKLDSAAILDKQEASSTFDFEDNLSFKLLQAGLTKKEYNEGKLLLAFIGLILICAFLFLSSNIIIQIIGCGIGLGLIFLGGKIHLFISKKERSDKINTDLGTFLDLINVILEAGGGLRNAFFTVSTRANGILDDALLREISILEYEMANYPTKVAYENFKKRIDSEDVDKIIDFLILSEEAGIGVKEVFAAQSDEIRQEKHYKVKGKVNTLNMYLMLIIFIFIVPALGAFIFFPMQAGRLQIGL